jgi:hypothetical protein
MVVSEAPQLFVHKRRESPQGFFVALSPLMQKFGDLAGQIFGHDALPAPFWQRATAYSPLPRPSIAFGFFVQPSTRSFFRLMRRLARAFRLM